MIKILSIVLAMSLSLMGVFAGSEDRLIMSISLETPEEEMEPITTGHEEESEDELIKIELEVVLIDGVNMVHIRSVLEEFGFELKYNSLDKTVEVIRGPYHSVVKVNENSYYKHRMAPRSLSSAPIIKDNKMYVPIEYLTLMADIAVNSEEDSLVAHNKDFAKYSGFISEIEETVNGKKLILTDESLEYDMDTAKIIHVSKRTLLNGDLVEGEFVEIISSPIVLLSLPPQMDSVVVFQAK